MLHNLLRSLGRPSHTTGRLSRRKFSPDAQRSETGIERLEKRMLLSAATYDEYSAVELFGVGQTNQGGLGNEVSFSGPDLAASDSVVAAYLYWQGVDLISEGGDGVYDESSITINGSVVTGEALGVSDSFGRGEGGSGAFRADVSEFLHSGTSGSGQDMLLISGMATKPGHRMDKAEFVVLIRSESSAGSTIWLRTSGIAPLSLVNQTFSAVTTTRPTSITPPPPTTPPLPTTPPENNRPRGGGHLIIWRVAEGDPVEFKYYLSGQDFDGDSMRLEIVSPPDVGTVEFDKGFIAPGSFLTHRDFSFKAPDGWRGTSSFTARWFDGLEHSNVFDVWIYVETDHPPTLKDQTFRGAKNQPVVGKLEWHDADDDQLFVDVKEPPAVGTLVVSDDTTGGFVYTPPKGFSGVVSFTYGVRGHWGVYSLTATVTIVVEPVAEPVHEQPPVERPPGEKPALPPVAHPHSQPVASPFDDQPIFSPNAVEPTHMGNDLFQAAAVFVPPASNSDDLRQTKVTTVIDGAAERNVSRLLAHSLRLTRSHENGRDAPDVAMPVSYEYLDVNGDDREDLRAVLDLDWSDVWDGYESALLTGRIV